MRNKVTYHNWTDRNGNPAGGVAFGNGFTISWQNGPLGRHHPNCIPGNADGDRGTCVNGCMRKDPNGAFVEDVLVAVIERLKFYQNGRFACQHNEEALGCLGKALDLLNERTRDRSERGVEGTHAS